MALNNKELNDYLYYSSLVGKPDTKMFINVDSVIADVRDK